MSGFPISMSGVAIGNVPTSKCLKFKRFMMFRNAGLCASNRFNIVDEKELSEKIADYLNTYFLNEFKFEFIDDFCDLEDATHRIYIEVKTDHFAPAQIVHALTKQKIKDAKFLGVTDGRILKLYKPPKFEKMLSFSTKYDPELRFSPSQVDKPNFNEEAESLLGEPEKIIELDLDSAKFIYITKKNLKKKIKPLLDKYGIETNLLAAWLDGVLEHDTLKVNGKGSLVNIETGSIFMNEHIDEGPIAELRTNVPRPPKHKPIREKDIKFFESLRISHNDLQDILHEADRFLSTQRRRQRGVFWTESDIGDKLGTELLQLTGADYVVEPCVGGGSLIRMMASQVKGAMNDIDPIHVDNTKKVFDGYGWKATSLDIVTTQTSELLRAWEVPKNKTLLVYSNPPFGISSTNKLTSTMEELGENKSRQQKIAYSKELLKYGKGDQLIPIIGRFIEIAKVHQNCYLAFFSPLGLLCGRRRYEKLFSALSKDFEFIKGYVFAGNKFHDINKTLAISMTIWRYSPNTFTRNVDLSLEFLDKEGKSKTLKFKEMRLLKDGWRYRDGSRYVRAKSEDAIGVARCDRFNTPQPKVFSVDVAEGSGAEVSPENLKTDKVALNIPSVPSELAFGLWSVSVGRRSYETSMSVILHPIYFEGSYVHLPDFSKKETLEILAYSALFSLVVNYAGDRIGFFGTNNVLRFGNQRLTNSVKYLLSMCKDCLVYKKQTIEQTLELIKINKLDRKEFYKGIRREVYKRLDAIGYWDYIPLPMKQNGESKTSPLTEFTSLTDSSNSDK